MKIFQGSCWCFTFLLTWLLSLLGYFLLNAWMAGKINKHSMKEQFKLDFILLQPSDAYEEELTNTDVVPLEIEHGERLEEVNDFPGFLTAKGSHGNDWSYRSYAIFPALLALIACNEGISRQFLLFGKLCNMPVAVFKTALPALNLILVFMGLQIESFHSPQVALLKRPERMAPLEVPPFCFPSEWPSTIVSNKPVCNIFFETSKKQCSTFLSKSVLVKEHVITDVILQNSTMTAPKANLFGERHHVSWFGQKVKPILDSFSGRKSTKKKRPWQQHSGSKNDTDSTDQNQSQRDPNEPAEQEQDTSEESGDTPTSSPSNHVAGTTGGNDGDDGDDPRRGRDDDRCESNKTNERNSQTNINVPLMNLEGMPTGNHHIRNRIELPINGERANEQISLPHGEEEHAAERHDNDIGAEGHDDDVSEGTRDNAFGTEEYNDNAEEHLNQARNIGNKSAFNPFPVNGFGVQERGLDTDNQYFVDDEVRENRPIRPKLQSPHDDD
ncbi:uncharacterized protein [Watersipora subatra]|uniref:uncharacterized protein n=1 Tax=Watersipora subatra TaxID=2589382 RepID=UPI00355BFD54